MNIPVPPSQPDLALMHRHLLSMNNFMKSMFQNGNQATQKTQAEINGLTGLGDSGKFVQNTTTGKINYSEIDNGVTVWKEL